MIRRVLASAALGVACGVGAAFVMTDPVPAALTPQPTVAGWDAVQTGLRCWKADGPIPHEFGGMTVLAVDAVSQTYILGRHGRTVLIGPMAPGIACVLSEGAEA